HLLYFGLATNGGNQALTKQAPNAAKGDEIIARRLAEPFRGDANDVLYQWESSFDYDPSSGLDRIQAELGVMERELKRIRNARYLLLPASVDTRGHSTTGMAKLYKKDLAEL